MAAQILASIERLGAFRTLEQRLPLRGYGLRGFAVNNWWGRRCIGHCLVVEVLRSC